MTGRMGYDRAMTSPNKNEHSNAAVRLRGRDRKTVSGQTGENKIFWALEKSKDFLEAQAAGGDLKA